MIVGLLSVDLALFEAQTLKEKRRVVQSLKQKIRDRFNVSVADVGFQDEPKRCRLGVAMVSNDTRRIHSQFDKLVELVRHARGATLLDYERRFL